MGKIKTPIIRPLRTKGGTLYTFSSAVEDIGLNINESYNKVRLSHYALLDIPNGDEISMDDNYNEKNYRINKFNVFSMPGAMWERMGIDAKNNNDGYNGGMTETVNQQIAQSFLSYALNMETVIRNSGKYDYTTSLSTSERIFWKWLKETGAIRWTYNDEDNGYFREDTNDVNYKSVVKSFGKIDAMSQRSSDYGMYNEVFVNVPSSFGYINPIFFKRVEDKNYSSGRVYKTTFTETLENISGENKILSTDGLYNVPFFDNEDEMNNWDASIIYTTENNNESVNYWFQMNGNIPSIANNTLNNYGYYIIDQNINLEDKNITDEYALNDLITVDYTKMDTSTDLKYQFLRSKLDCMSLELDLNNIQDTNAYKNRIINSYDDLAIGDDTNEERNYEFNVILLYYSIFDNNDNILATNLYGVYFLDSPIDLKSESSSLNFELPRLSKQQSSGDGFGTSYSFRINIRTSSIYDNTESQIFDDGSSENSVVTDFNNVVANLNRSVELLAKHVKNSDRLVDEYNNVNRLIIDTRDRLQIVEKNLNDLLFTELNDVTFNDVTTKTISVDDNIKFSNNIKFITENKNVINITEENISFDANILANNINTNDLTSDNIKINDRIIVDTTFKITTSENDNMDSSVVPFVSFIQNSNSEAIVDISNNILKSNKILYSGKYSNENNSRPVESYDTTNILNIVKPIVNNNKIECYIDASNRSVTIPGINYKSEQYAEIDIPSMIFALITEVNNLRNEISNLK